jgi:hypothetical protein
MEIEETKGRRGWFALLYAAPLVLLLLNVALPLIRGTETYVLRDVLNTHLEMKVAQAEAMRAGYFPLLDPYRAGGQPLAGNPNAVPFYPTNLLFLIGSPIWALHAQFWIHLLLAPFAFYWMARSWGLPREPAWAAAACYTLCGFYLSHLSFYNLIAGATLAPALVAASLDFHRLGGRRAWTAPALAGLWGLLLLGGDPLMAALAIALAGGAVLPYWIRRGERPGWSAFFLFAVSFAAGTLLALPQILEFLRILPISFRGHWGYSEKVATVASWDPRQIVEWVIPQVFGRLDRISFGSFWGSRFFTDVPPYYPSLYPGLLALALVAASGRPAVARRRAAWWAWGGIAAGLFFSLGRFNPLVAWLFGLEGQSSLRYPVKFWMPVAVGGALLCGLGFEKLGEEPARRRVRWVLLVLALALAGFWIFLSFSPAPAEAWMAGVMRRSGQFVTNERLRWAGLCLLSLAVLAALGIALRIGRRRPYLGGALLLAVHALAQVFFLRPVYPTDAVVPYEVRPPLLAYLPEGASAVNPEFNSLFGQSQLKTGHFPGPEAFWLERRAFQELYPFTGAIWKRRYELNTSPEGLDTFLTRMAQGCVKRAKDDERIRMLAAWGVNRLILNRRLDPALPGIRLLTSQPSFGKEVNIYEITRAAPELLMARRVIRAPHLNAAYVELIRPDFDPGRDVVIAGDGPTEAQGGGTAQFLRKGPEELEIEAVAGKVGAVLMVQRAFHLWKATVDGKPAEVLTANFHRVGVQVPEGKHRVRLWIDRTKFHRSLWGAGLGLALLPLLGVWGGRKRQQSAPVNGIEWKDAESEIPGAEAEPGARPAAPESPPAPPPGNEFPG